MPAPPQPLVELIHVHNGLKVLADIRRRQGWPRPFLSEERYAELERHLQSCPLSCDGCQWRADCVKHHTRTISYLEVVH